MDGHPSSTFFNAPLLPPFSIVDRLAAPRSVLNAPSSSLSVTDNSAKRRRLSSGIGDKVDSGQQSELLETISSSGRGPESQAKSWTWSAPATWSDERSTTNAVEHLSIIEPGLRNATSLTEVTNSTATQGSATRPMATNASLPNPYVRRKRAIAACQFCRSRKTKCDNVRPVCGSCRRHQARCVYTDGSEGDGLQVGLDEAADRHREVLERLEDIRNLLGHPSTVSANPPDSDEPASVSPSLGQEAPNHENEGTALPGITGKQNALEHRTQTSASGPSPESLNYLHYTKCESILKWPALRPVMTNEDAAIESFIFDAYIAGDGEEAPLPFEASGIETSSPRPSSRGTNGKQSKAGPVFGQGVRDQAFVTLCRKFLALVNCRNPIMDGKDLLQYASSAAEDGLGWDAKSCLVLIACALASYSRAWTPPSFDSTPASESPAARGLRRGSGAVPPDVMSTSNDEAAEAYYEAAQKRFGGLGTSLIDIQCFYFASLFEKFAFRPVKSWMHLQQAATRLRIHHMIRPRQGQEDCGVDYGLSTISYHFEQRAFWSIHKAEREFATELGITLASDLSCFEYPVAFPTPPETLDQVVAADDGDDAGLSDYSSPRRNQLVWFFYLAQISLRRSLDEVLSVIYEKGEKHWIENIDLVCRQYYESKKQIADWQSHLPPTMRYDPASQPDNEMGYYLESRFEEWNESIIRPLVYYCLHHPPTRPPTPVIADLAQCYMELCVDCITRSSSYDRHGGTWFVLRRAFRFTLVILAAVVADGALRPPDNWRELSQTTVNTLTRWSPGVRDLQRMRRVLDRVYRSVCEVVDDEPRS